MKNKKYIFISLFAFLFSASLSHAVGSGVTSFSSLKMIRGARPAALAGAYLALADDAQSILANPAGLCRLRDPQLTASHLSWLDGVQDDFVAMGIPLYGLGAWGIGMNYLYTSDMARDNWGNPAGDFNVFDFSAQLSLAVDLGRRVAIGGTYKILRQGYETKFAMGSAFDLGMQFKGVFHKKLDFAFGVFNAGTDMALGENFSRLPLVLKTAVAIRFTRDWLITGQYEHEPNDFFNRWRLATEYDVRLGNVDAAVRGGYIIGPENEAGDLSGLTVGLGLGLGPADIDYAFAPMGDLGQSHRVSFTWTLE